MRIAGGRFSRSSPERSRSLERDWAYKRTQTELGATCTQEESPSARARVSAHVAAVLASPIRPAAAPHRRFTPGGVDITRECLHRSSPSSSPTSDRREPPGAGTTSRTNTSQVRARWDTLLFNSRQSSSTCRSTGTRLTMFLRISPRVGILERTISCGCRHRFPRNRSRSWSRSRASGPILNYSSRAPVDAHLAAELSAAHRNEHRARPVQGQRALDRRCSPGSQLSFINPVRSAAREVGRCARSPWPAPSEPS